MRLWFVVGLSTRRVLGRGERVRDGGVAVEGDRVVLLLA